MSDAGSVDAIRALLPANGAIADQLQIFAIKQVQQTQQATVLGLIATMASLPTVPGLGDNIDVSL